MFYGRRVVDIPDGKPKWTGLNNQSDLIEDSPPDLKRKRAKEDMVEKRDKRENGGEREKENKREKEDKQEKGDKQEKEGES